MATNFPTTVHEGTQDSTPERKETRASNKDRYANIGLFATNNFERKTDINYERVASAFDRKNEAIRALSAVGNAIV